LAFLFLYCSRVSEMIPQVRLSAPLLLILACIMAVTLRFTAIWELRAGKILMAFTLWSVVCVPFSVWPGGTIMFVQSGVRSLLTVALMAAFIRTVREAINAMYVVGFAMAFAAAMSFWAGSTVSNAGRLVLADNSTLGDPNFYCYYVLSGLPFLALGASLTKGVKRAGFIVSMFPIFVVIGKTGSRMGVLAFAAGLLFTFFISPPRYKIFLVALTGAAVLTAMVALPSQVLDRFTTFFTADENTAEAQMAISSTESRRYLLQRGLEITMDNPVLGVGPGMFAIAEGAEAAEMGIKGAWHATHNNYVQISSEMGIPGAILYIWALLHSFVIMNKIRKTGPDQRSRQAALFTQIAFVTVFVSLMFLTVGYGGVPYVLIAVAGCLQAALFAAAKSNQQGARVPVRS
jgi:O-antigen ligase